MTELIAPALAPGRLAARALLPLAGTGLALALAVAGVGALRAEADRARRAEGRAAAAEARAGQALAVLSAERASARRARAAEVRHLDALARIRADHAVLLQEIPDHVPQTDRLGRPYDVPVGFVRLWNAASAGQPLAAVSDPAGRPDDAASGLGLAAVAERHAEDARAYAEIAARLSALQAFVRQEAKAADDVCARQETSGDC